MKLSITTTSERPCLVCVGREEDGSPIYEEGNDCTVAPVEVTADVVYDEKADEILVLDLSEHPEDVLSEKERDLAEDELVEEWRRKHEPKQCGWTCGRHRRAAHLTMGVFHA